jgi:hypothetical protein
MSAEIDDLRLPAQFKGMSFSGFKKTDVRKQFLQNMIKGRIEPACYWAAELICAGQFADLWENIFHFMAKHIHLGNAKMPMYIAMRYGIFNNIVDQRLFSNEIQLRNNATVRRLFAEIICNLTLSPRKPSFETTKIVKKEEFDITQMGERLKADRADYADALFQEKDPRELLIPINEFLFELKRKNMSTCCYWVEWIIEFDAISKANKRPTRCVPRDYKVEQKFRGDIIWFIWDAILAERDNRGDAFIGKIIGALLTLFCAKYTTAAAKKRRYLLYMAIETLTEQVHPNIEIVANMGVLENVVAKIDEVYKQIKKNETGSGSDYLFDGMSKEANFQRTVQKLEMMGF